MREVVELQPSLDGGGIQVRELGEVGRLAVEWRERDEISFIRIDTMGGVSDCLRN